MRFWLFIFLFSSSPLFGQHYLMQFQGEYQGTLYLCYPNRQCDSVSFGLNVQPTEDPNRINTTMTYNVKSENTMEKNYDCIIDTTFKDNCHYIVDEKDGILLRETRIDNVFYSSYTLNNQIFYVRTAYFKERIEFELQVFDNSNALVSLVPSDVDNSNEPDRVFSANFVTVQRGTLYKL